MKPAVGTLIDVSGVISARSRFILLAISLALPAVAHAQEIDSVYRSYDWENDCRMVERDQSPEAAGMGVQLVCPGPQGLYLMLTEGDARISMDYGSTPDLGPWESFSPFNTVRETVEWRRQRRNGEMQPFATIHRWEVGPSYDYREVLVISTVATAPGEESCIVGVVDTTDTPEANVLARAVADRYAADFVCGNAQARAFGHVGLDTPLPHRVVPRPDIPTGD